MIPVTKADQTVDKADPNYEPLNNVDAQNWDACKFLDRFRLRIHSNYLVADDAAIYDGAPVGVQIVARKYEEEKVWAIAKIVDDIIKSSSTSS